MEVVSCSSEKCHRYSSCVETNTPLDRPLKGRFGPTGGEGNTAHLVDDMAMACTMDKQTYEQEDYLYPSGQC